MEAARALDRGGARAQVLPMQTARARAAAAPAPDTESDSPRDLLARLVGFPTVSSETNLPLIDWAEGWLAARGIAATRVPSPCGRKASLYAHVGPEGPGGVLLSGHTDVVPVEGQHWTSDPFTLTERDGRLHGRGTADMKGFVALALWAMGEAARRGVARPLQIALTRDEEVGCIGAPQMLAHMAESGFPRAAAAIIGEPTRMACVTAHKGSAQFPIEVRGHEVHSATPHLGVSAIMEAARVIDWANEVNAERAAAPPSEMAALFDPPHTTLHVGQIAGGTAHNITAGRCSFGLGVRAVPGETAGEWRTRILGKLAEVSAPMRAVHPETGFSIGEVVDVPPLAPQPDNPAEHLVRRLTGDNGTHVVSYGTEAGQFQQAGFAAVVCGPGDIAQAHQADEFIELAQMQEGQRFMERLLDDLARGPAPES